MVLCPSCGGENSDGVKFCVRCGAPFTSAAPNAGSWQQPSGNLYDSPPAAGSSEFGDQPGSYNTPSAYSNYPTYNPPAMPYQQVSPTYWQDLGANKKIPAGICAILLGAFGIHKFIMGYTTEGVIMLLITVLTCGIGAMATGVIALVEGIIYLTKSDEDFVRTYIQNKKGWF